MCDVPKSRDNLPELSLKTPEAGERGRRRLVSVEPHSEGKSLVSAYSSTGHYPTNAEERKSHPLTSTR